MSNLEPFLLEWLLIQMVTDTHSTRDDKVHLKDFFLLVKYDVFLLLLREIAWHESKSHIVKELGVFVFLRVEEDPKVIENIIKQVVHYDSSLY